jgi:hypothetical protein
MTEKLKQPLILVGLVILMVAVIAIVTSGSDLTTDSSDRAGEEVKMESALKTDHVHTPNGTNKGSTGAATANNAASGTAQDKVPRHQDMLNEEMKQAIRDDLILHGPQETFEKPDGTVVLPSSGRSTQVSVAVQMPDGSIQIREYSELPKDSKPVYTVAPQPSN